MKKSKYFPNNWKAYKESPDQFFIPLTYDDFYNWKVMGWALPSSVACIIREETNGKITERVYSQSSSAQKYIDSKMKVKNAKTTYTICDDAAVQLLFPLKDQDKYEHLELDPEDMGEFISDEDQYDPDDFDLWLNDDYD